MKRYITTPLYYVNSTPHIGHAYTTILADVLKRYYSQRGDQVHLLTGTDEHGQKIEQSAAKAGKPPQQFVDEIAGHWKEAWERLGLEFDQFYRTTSKSHVAAVQHALQFLKDQGDIVFREYSGLYCVGCERFRTEQEITPEGLCPDHQTKPEQRKESNYFFLMSRYQKQLIEHIEKHPEYIQPENYRTEILSFLKQPLGDLCISRPKERLNWGIELPFDSKYVTYVWFDALLNYLAARGWPKPDYDVELWKQAVHLIGKDIIVPHGVYWSTMLMALGVPLYQGLQVNGYLLIGGNKVSKSIGNVVHPDEIREKWGVEPLRFYLLREMVYGSDAVYTTELFIQANNAYLANGIGNLVSRVMTLAVKHLGTGVALSHGLTGSGAIEEKLRGKRNQLSETFNASFAELKFQNALKAWSELVTETDVYINEAKPWSLAKDPAQAERLREVLVNCLRAIQTLAVVIYPVLPNASKEILRALGLGTGEMPVPALALDDSRAITLSGEVPKLFARFQLEPPPGAETKK